METGGVVFYSCNKKNYISKLFEKIFVSVTNTFLIKYVACIKEYTFT